MDMNDKQLNDISKVIQETYKEFEINIEIDKIVSGHRLLCFHCVAQKSNDLSRVSALILELERVLTASPLSINHSPDDELRFDIIVPKESSGLPLRWSKTLASNDLGSTANKLNIPLGEMISGEQYCLDFNNAKHLLIGGCTGSGKSNLIHVIINTLVRRYSPQELKLVLMDPKRVELLGYEGIPYLDRKVVLGIDGCRGALNNLLSEIDFRKTLKKEALVMEPVLFVVIDELSDFMSAEPIYVEKSLVEIAVKGHEVGIHLIVSTSRPSVDIYTKRILDSIPTHLAGQTASSVDSMTILNKKGAERLLGSGDMLIKTEAEERSTRFQAYYITVEEIKEQVDEAKKITVEKINKFISLVPETLFRRDFSKINSGGTNDDISGIPNSQPKFDLWNYSYYEKNELGKIFVTGCWVEYGKILTPEEGDSIVFVKKQHRMHTGYYERDGEFMAYPFTVDFVNMGKNDHGVTIWEVTEGQGLCGETWRIQEKDGEILLQESINTYVI